MSDRVNRAGQPIGAAVGGWVQRPRPPRTVMVGAMVGWYAVVESVAVGRHAEDLFSVYMGAPDGPDWTHLPAEATIYKGRSRDTAWYSITDDEWPGIRAAFEAWLDPRNFDADGRQQRCLRGPGAVRV